MLIKDGDETALITEGKKADDDKQDWTLLPWRAVEQVVRVLEFGARKYGRNNWMSVPDMRRRYLAAAFRHLTAYAEGETKDSESGLPHLAHAVCCLLFIMWFGYDASPD